MKKILLFTIIFILLLVTVKTMSKTSDLPLWEKNALQFSKSFEDMDGYEPKIIDLITYTHFKWDKLYSFQPYYPKDKIYDVVGYQWADIAETVSEGMNQVVFMNEGKVVCYIYGYPDRYNLYIDFGYYNYGHLEIAARDRTKFVVTVRDDNVKNLHFIEE